MKKIDLWKNAILEKMENSRIWDIVNESVDYPYQLLSSVEKDGVTTNRYLCPECFEISEVQFENYVQGVVRCKHCGHTGRSDYIFSSDKGVAYWKEYRSWDRLSLFAVRETVNGVDGLLYIKASEVHVYYDTAKNRIRASYNVVGYGFLSADERFDYSNGRYTKARFDYESYRAIPLFLSSEAKSYFEKCGLFSENELHNTDYWLFGQLQNRAGMNKDTGLSLYEKKAIAIQEEYPVVDMNRLPVRKRAYLTVKLKKSDMLNDRFYYDVTCLSCGKHFSHISRNKVFSGNRTLTCKHCQKGDEVLETNGCHMDNNLYIEKVSDNVVVLRFVRVWIKAIGVGKLKPSYSEVERIYLNLEKNSSWNCIHLSNADGPWKLKKKRELINNWKIEPESIIILPGADDVLKYTGFSEYIKERKDRFCSYESTVYIDELYRYLYACTVTDCLEKIIKLGWPSICDSVSWDVFYDDGHRVDFEADSLTDVLGLPKRLIKKMAEINNPSIDDLGRFQTFYRIDYDVMVEDIDWCKEHMVSPKDIGDITELLGINVHQACEYLERVRVSQCYDPKAAIIEWFDYLNASKNIEADLSDKTVRYPSSLKREHDKATFKFKIVQDEKKEEIFQSVCQDYGKKFSYEDDSFMITTPKSMQDLFEEGRRLNHCVGTYADRVCEGKTCICFLRRKIEPEKPYFTIEVSPSEYRVRQIHGLSNRLVDKRRENDLYLFLKRWAKQKKINISVM